MAEQIADYFIATLASPITSSSTALTVTTSGLPTSPNYSIVIDGNTSIQEACRVTGVSGNTLTVTRAAEPLNGVQTAFVHGAGATVQTAQTALSLTAAINQLALTQITLDNILSGIGVQVPNTLLAGPTSGSSTDATFRALVAADLPAVAGVSGSYTSLNATIDSFGRVVVAANGSGVSSFNTRTGAVTLVQSDVTTALGYSPAEPVNATSHQWINSINSSGVPQLSQPAFSDISGSIATGQVPTLNQNTTGQAGTVATISELLANGTNTTVSGLGTAVSPYEVNGNAGTVTSIVAGNGLSGGTITGSGTVSINESYSNTWTSQQQFNTGLVTQGLAAITITTSTIAISSNVCTIPTTTPPAVGQWVIVAGFSTVTAANGGPFLVTAVVAGTSFSFALTAANASHSDSGTVSVCQRVILNSSGTVDGYVTAAGQTVYIAASASTVGLVVQGAVSQTANLQNWTDSSGNVYLSVGFNASQNQAIVGSATNDIVFRPLLRVAMFGSSGTYPVCIFSNSLNFGSTGSIAWTATANSAAGGGADTTLVRVAPSVIGPTNASGGAGYFQNTGGRARLANAATNATATPANLSLYTTGTTPITLIAGRKYTGRLILYANNSVAAEGLQFDFNGGTATMTSFEAAFSATPPGSGLILGTLTTTALGTPLTVTTATTGDVCYTIEFTMVCNAAGTFIPRFAEVAHTTGTATVELGSNMWAEDMGV